MPPSDNLEYKGNKAIDGKNPGLWEEYVDKKTGKSTLAIHELKVIATWCKPSEHEWHEIGSTRKIICSKCSQESFYVLGMHKLVDGKLIPITPLASE